MITIGASQEKADKPSRTGVAAHICAAAEGGPRYDPNMTPEERKQLDELDDTVTVYRGVTSYNADNVLALSWSLEYDTANWFAHRFDEDGTVYQAQIDKKHILALFNGRNEAEVIVNPHCLTQVMEAEEMNQGFTQSM